MMRICICLDPTRHHTPHLIVAIVVVARLHMQHLRDCIWREDTVPWALDRAEAPGVYTCAYVHMHACRCACRGTWGICAYACMRVGMHAGAPDRAEAQCIHMHIHTHMHAHMHAHTHIHAYNPAGEVGRQAGSSSGFLDEWQLQSTPGVRSGSHCVPCEPCICIGA